VHDEHDSLSGVVVCGAHNGLHVCVVCLLVLMFSRPPSPIKNIPKQIKSRSNGANWGSALTQPLKPDTRLTGGYNSTVYLTGVTSPSYRQALYTISLSKISVRRDAQYQTLMVDDCTDAIFLVPSTSGAGFL
jgi:hypothetical protein